MGVYIFEFTGQTTDGRRWFKLGHFNAQFNPWKRFGPDLDGFESLARFGDVMMPGNLTPHNFALCRWYPTLDYHDELRIHKHFSNRRFGEWYDEGAIGEVDEFIRANFDDPVNKVDASGCEQVCKCPCNCERLAGPLLPLPPLPFDDDATTLPRASHTFSRRPIKTRAQKEKTRLAREKKKARAEINKRKRIKREHEELSKQVQDLSQQVSDLEEERDSLRLRLLCETGVQ